MVNVSHVITNAEIKNIVCKPSDLNYIVNIGNIYLEEKNSRVFSKKVILGHRYFIQEKLRFPSDGFRH